MKNDIQLKELYRKVADGTATKQERQLFNGWYNSLSSVPQEPISEERLMAAKQRIFDGIDLGRQEVMARPAYRLWYKMVAAASVVVIVSAGIYFYRGNVAKQDLDQVAMENRIVPGNDRAVLTLADGRQIDLTGAGNGELAEQGGVKVSKSADGQLVYEFSGAAKGAKGYNMVSTPRGGQHQVSLPDGSKVWLNAASSLRFPVSFASMPQRKVELTGEAYFEVTKDKDHPFLVASAGQTVEVLGTHFDVNAYGDGGKMKTTLLEGSVRLVGGNAARVLLPGQQGILYQNSLSVGNVKTESAVAWKEGYFSFKNESLENIMSSLSRWYDVDVEYKDEEIRDDPFWGTVSRFAKVGDVLKVLERTGEVHFRIEGRKIIVSK